MTKQKKTKTNEEKLNEKLASGREYRKFTRQIEVRAADDGQDGDSYKVEGYATVFNTPYVIYDWGDYEVDEQIDPNAFDDCDMSDVIMQFDHMGRVFARTSNNTLTVKADETGLHIEADLGGTEGGRSLFEDIKGGYVTKMSFGFTVDEDQRVITDDNTTGKTTVLRTITKIGKLYDVSAVSLPANDATEISVRNLGDGLIKEIETERSKHEEQVKEMRAECMKNLEPVAIENIHDYE